MYTMHSNRKQELVGLFAGLIVVGTSPLMCIAQRPPSRAMAKPLSPATAALRPASSASRANTPTVMQPRLGVAAVQGSRPGADSPANQPASAKRPASIAPVLRPAKVSNSSLVNAKPLLPQRPTLPNRVTARPTEGTRPGGGQKVVSAVRPGLINRPTLSNRFPSGPDQGTRVGGGQSTVSAVRPGAIGGPIIRPSELRPQIIPGSKPIVTQTNPATTSVARPTNIIAIAKSNTDDGRFDSSKLGLAPMLLTPSGAPLRQEAPKPPQVKNVPVKGPLKVISQVLLQRRDGVFLRRILVDMSDGHETGYVVTEELSRHDLERFAESLFKENPKHVIIRTIDGTLYDDSDSGYWIAFGNPKAPFYYWPKGTVNATDLKGTLAPFDSPEADIIPGGSNPNGVPNHQQGDGKGDSNPGPNPGGPPAGTNKPDPSGMAGRPGPQPGTGNESKDRPEDMGPMPPPGETTVEFENEYGPPPPEQPPKNSLPGISDEQYMDLRGCLLYGCSNLQKSSDASGATGGAQENTGGGGDDNGSSTEDDSGSDDNSSSDDEEEEKDDDNNSSSGSDDGGDTSEVGYTPGADGAGGSQPAGAEELKYALFQQLGYLFHSRNFGPRFPLVGDPRPEAGGPEGNQNGPQGTAQLDPSTFPSGKKTKTGSNKDVLVNGDLRKKTSPVGPDKASAEDGFSDQFLRAFEVIDPVPIDK